MGVEGLKSRQGRGVLAAGLTLTTRPDGEQIGTESGAVPPGPLPAPPRSIFHSAGGANRVTNSDGVPNAERVGSLAEGPPVRTASCFLTSRLLLLVKVRITRLL